MTSGCSNENVVSNRSSSSPSLGDKGDHHRSPPSIEAPRTSGGRTMGLIFLFTLVDILGFSIVLPLLPFYSDQYGATPAMNGWLLSSNAIAQLLTAPIIGYLSDKHGRRPMLLFCLLGTTFSFGVLYFARDYKTVFLSRVLDGLFGGNISLATSCMCDITTPGERARGLGLIGAAFGVGFVLGPLMGGLLCSRGMALPILAAGMLSVANLIGVYFFLPECRRPPQTSSKEIRHASALDVCKMVVYSPTLRPLLLTRLFAGLAFSTFETSSSIFTRFRLAYDASQSSYVLGYVGLLFAIMQGGVMRRFLRSGSSSSSTRGTALTSEYRWLQLACAVEGLSLASWGLSSTTASLLVSLAGFALSAGAVHTLTSSVISREGSAQTLGSTMGIAASVGSLTRIIAPVVAGYFISWFGEGAAGFLGATWCFLAIGTLGSIRRVRVGK